MAAVNSAAANLSAPAARAASIAPCAWFISLWGGSAQLAERMASDERQAANRTKHVSRVYDSGTRAAGAASAPERASISYHEGSGAMATVPVVDRPREKLARVGAEALGDNELVALVLGSGTRSRGALVVAQDVIAAAGGVQGLVRIGTRRAVPGAGRRPVAGGAAAGGGRARAPHACSAIAASGRRCCRPRTWSATWRRAMRASAVERFGVMLLDQKQRVIRSVILSTGTIEASVSHPRDVFRVGDAGVGLVRGGVSQPSVGRSGAERRRPGDDAPAVRWRAS